MKLPVTMENALQRQSARDLQINTIIDVGAAKGSWTRLARKFWPDAKVLMIEANPYWQNDLKTCAANKNAQYVLAAASSKCGETSFLGSDTNPMGGSVSKSQSEKDASQRLPATTLDHEIKRLKLPGPYLIKLDTHGHDREIMKGATSVLGNTNLIVAEAYNFGEEQRLFHRMLLFFGKKGFRCIDIADPVFRPADKALWQLDLFLVPSNRPEFSKKGFQAN
ncbi:MAG: FkbM family methyltransferase [Opitutales bacterium]|nr:FkbM family methyltransferase [Opitutales bacterium]